MSDLLLLAIGTFAVIAACALLSLVRTRDTLNPVALFGGMLAFQYVYYPVFFELKHAHGLRTFLTEQQLVYAQTVFLLGSGIFLLGMLAGAGRVSAGHSVLGMPTVSEATRQRSLRVAALLGVVSVGSFLGGSLARGDLSGVDSDFGYLNEAYHLCIPALAFYLLSLGERRPSTKELVVCLALLSPLLLRGLLVAKRGPLLLFSLALSSGWCSAARARPTVVQGLVGGIAILTLVVFIFLNRDAIWSGDRITTEVQLTEISSLNPGNDYIYGATTLNFASMRGEHGWGANYFITYFIRPIPRQIWPSKYEDAQEILGLSVYSSIGTRTEYLKMASVSWGISVADGAAWGLVTDLYWEFGSLGIGLLGVVGFAIGRLWRASARSPIAFVVYICVISTAPYMVAQDLMDSGFRIIFMTVPAIAIFSVLAFFDRERERIRHRLREN